MCLAAFACVLLVVFCVCWFKAFVCMVLFGVFHYCCGLCCSCLCSCCLLFVCLYAFSVLDILYIYTECGCFVQCVWYVCLVFFFS